MSMEKTPLNGSSSFLVTNIQRYSVNDGPGIRTTVFLKGCPLSCAWCHNPESINPHQEFFFDEEKCVRCGACASICPENAISPPVERKRVKDPEVKPIISSSRSIVAEINNGTFGSESLFSNAQRNTSRMSMAADIEEIEMSTPVFDREKCTNCMQCVAACQHGALYPASRRRTLDEVYEEVLADQLFYETSGGGMTISGGEPLLQPSVTRALLKRARADGIHTALDTTGFTKWETIERVLPDVDLVLFDVKVLDDVKHKKWTGVSNTLILENLKKIAATGTPIRLRCVIVHNVNFWELNHPRAIVDLAKSLGKSVVGIDIMPYHNFAEKKYERIGRKYVFKGFPNLFNEDVEEYRKIIAANGPWQPTVGGLASSENTTVGGMESKHCWAG